MVSSGAVGARFQSYRQWEAYVLAQAERGESIRDLLIQFPPIGVDRATAEVSIMKHLASTRTKAWWFLGVGMGLVVVGAVFMSIPDDPIASGYSDKPSNMVYGILFAIIGVTVFPFAIPRLVRLHRSMLP